MKQASKNNDTEILELINKIHAQLILLDKKVDALSSPKPAADTNRRVMHTAICADCKKECSIPFKPSPDRPVYCQDCFSRRKVISLSGIKVEDKAPVKAPEPAAKKKKKPVPKKK
jgi:CxxC-x17-CxxC domain-containing protein